MTLRTVLRRIVIVVSVAGALAVAALAVAYRRSDNNCDAVLAAVPADPMRAVLFCDYGAPDVLTIHAVDKPTPGEGQVLVLVRAAAINPVELHAMRGEPYPMRLDGGLRRPTTLRLGVDFAGTVVAVGPNVIGLTPGAAVFGGRSGALAEYVVVNERSVVEKPENVSFDQAAAVPVAGVTALQAVRDKGRVAPGHAVLINGASGGVGTFAVQIAKAHGAVVTGVSSTRNVDLVRSLGADKTIDYTVEDYTRSPAQYDVIIDMVGNHSLLANRRALRPTGIYVMVGGPSGRWLAPLDRVIRMTVLSLFIPQEFGFFIARLNGPDLATLRDLMQRGAVTPVIDRRYTLTEIREAIAYLETGRARGKVVVTIAGDSDL
jgi:NADPH:quinone reductase-like Zn-dependent oxidoreductase